MLITIDILQGTLQLNKADVHPNYQKIYVLFM